MSFPVLRAASIVTCAFAIVAGSVAASGRSASAEEATSEATAGPVNLALSATQFADLFGKPDPVAGTGTFLCALGEVRLFAGPMPTTFLPADGRLLQISFNPALFTGLLTT